MARIIIYHYHCPECGEEMPFFAILPYLKDWWRCASCRAKVPLSPHLLGRLWQGAIGIYGLLILPFIFFPALWLTTRSAEGAAVLTFFAAMIGAGACSLAGYCVGRFVAAGAGGRRPRRLAG